MPKHDANARSTPLVTVEMAALAAHVTPRTVRKWIATAPLQPVACVVRTRALLYPLAAVMRAPRDLRLRTKLRHARRAA